MRSNPVPRIIIADDHTFMADACKKMLEPEYDVVATVGDGRALVRIASTLKPRLIILEHRHAAAERSRCRRSDQAKYCFL